MSGMDAEDFRQIRDAVRQLVRDVVVPREEEIEDDDRIPDDLRAKAAEMGLFGYALPEEYGGLGVTMSEDVRLAFEFGYTTPAFRSLFGTNNGIAGQVIARFGSEEQKKAYLPRLAAGELIGSFALTEAEAGSDPSGLRTTARRDGDGWVLNGTKMWITNGGIADLAIVWARTDDGIRGFIVTRDAPGFTTRDIERKLSLRASVTSELILDDCRVAADAVLPDARGMRGPLSCLNEARYGIVWGSMGAARACFEAALDYSRSRQQFGKPIGSFQLTQRKLAEMATELAKGQLLALHLGRMKDEGVLRPEQVSLGKLNNVGQALQIARESRSILGASGVTLEYPVIRHMNNLESVFTYEGTNEIHQLVVGEALTGLRAFD